MSTALQAQLNGAPASAQVLAAVGLLVLVGATELILRAMTLPATRLLEGYSDRDHRGAIQHGHVGARLAGRELFALWAVPTWWWVLAAVGIGVSVVVFIAALPGAARTYAGLLEAAFDVRWRAFYDALDWPLPPSPAQEPKFGRAVTTHIWRGWRTRRPGFGPSPIVGLVSWMRRP
jgi:hypothetical protein